MKKYLLFIASILFENHLRISGEMFPENVWSDWSGRFYKNMTPDNITPETDWRTCKVKGKREELVFKGRCYIHEFPITHKLIYL